MQVENECLVPIGTNCKVAMYLRNKGMRKMAYPFDWQVIPLDSALNILLESNFTILEEPNIIFFPPERRLLAIADEADIKMENSLITPVLDKKYRILYPHDFSANSKSDLEQIRRKYLKRLNRVKNRLEKNLPTTFIYSIEVLNSWQKQKYETANVVFDQYSIEYVHDLMTAMKARHGNISFISLRKLKRDHFLERFSLI